MAIEGPLRELGIHDVFQLLDLGRKTGTLHVRSAARHDEGQVRFLAGAVVDASIASIPATIEEGLLQAGKLTAQALEDARTEQGRTGRLPLDVLAERGVITRKELERHIRARMEAVVFELLSWQEGYFSFEEALDAPPAPHGVRVSTESLLMEGARRIDEWSRLTDRIPSLAAVPALVPVTGDEGPLLDLLPTEWEVLALVDGERDLRTIAAFLGRAEFEVARVVYGLLTTGIVALGGATPRPRAPIMEGSEARADLALAIERGRAGDWAGSRGAARRAVAVDPLAPDGHRLLGDAAARLGAFDDARASWTHYLRIAPDALDAGRVRETLTLVERLTQLLPATADGDG